MTHEWRKTLIRHFYSAVCKSTFFRSLTNEMLWDHNEVCAFVMPGLHSLAELSVMVEHDFSIVFTLMAEGRRMTLTLSNAEAFSAMDFDDFSAVVQDIISIFKSTLPSNPNTETVIRAVD